MVNFNKSNYQTDTSLKEQKLDCSVIIDEVRNLLQLLRDSGVSETKIASLFHENKPLFNLIISRDYKIYLGDDRKEVHMEPLVKSLYLLFLQHPEGIVFKDLPDYRQELASIYNNVRPWGLTDRALHSIEDVTNPMLNSINEKCAKIKKVFEKMLDSSIAEQYYIKGTRGEAKKISLPRDLVTWE